MDDFPLAPLLGGALADRRAACWSKRFPMLIAGYNTLPPAKKKNVDIGGLIVVHAAPPGDYGRFMDPIYGRSSN